MNLRASWLLALLACGCTPAADRNPSSDAGERPERSAPATEPVEQAQVRLALLPPSREGNAAALQGFIEVEGPCLYLRGADGSRFLMALMTLDTRWEEERLKIGGRSYAPGERVTLGGSEADGRVADLAWVQPPDPSCDFGKLWITVSVDRAVGSA